MAIIGLLGSIEYGSRNPLIPLSKKGLEYKNPNQDASFLMQGLKYLLGFVVDKLSKVLIKILNVLEYMEYIESDI